MTSGLALGFVSSASPWQLTSNLFPDKIGGRPSWLALQHLPSPSQLACPICASPMPFLLQVYSTIDERTDCFHRSLFLFMCRNGPCHKQTGISVPFAVFRSQLGRQNPYYSFQPPETEYPSLDTVQALIKAGSFPCAERYNYICPICGCKADKLCSRCKRIKYCSKHHQMMHWKSYHKIDCSSEAPEAKREPRFDANDFLLPEFRVCSEPADESAAVEQDSEDSESDVLSDQGDEEFKELESVAKRETKAEARFRKFKDLMSSEPDQVIRLERGGTPFWLSETPPDIPNCEACGAKRVFEFQVTPQILNYLKLDRLGEASPDFGSLYVFTCSESCPLPRIQLASAEEVCESASTSVTVEYQSEVVVCQMAHDLSLLLPRAIAIDSQQVFLLAHRSVNELIQGVDDVGCVRINTPEFFDKKR
ncbi:pre-rRNA-processing protein TSR4 [Clonorchis sinensis]|uniref:Pre-rRNA-processing protein TSR4 n=1 Tax=Clonorchis sinensis TaxID=79923 RepID=G7YEH8_CLOSI|nr:pre-rRNA-processing protein TSR4 [Clonorchis sinensis]